MKKKYIYTDFKELLESVAVEKVPDGFTQKVMKGINPDYKEKIAPNFLPYLLWIGGGFLLALGYRIYKSGEAKINSDYFYFLAEDFYGFMQSFDFLPQKLFVYTVPIFAIILCNLIYENLRIAKYLP